jgi:hypothetical protein
MKRIGAIGRISLSVEFHRLDCLVGRIWQKSGLPLIHRGGKPFEIPTDFFLPMVWDAAPQPLVLQELD